MQFYPSAAFVGQTPAQLVQELWNIDIRHVSHEKLMLMMAWLRLRARVVTCWTTDRIRIGEFMETLPHVRDCEAEGLCEPDQALLHAFMAHAEALERLCQNQQ